MENKNACTLGLQEQKTYSTFTPGQITGRTIFDVEMEIERYFKKYPEPGYQSVTTPITWNSETRLYECKTNRLTSCE